MLAPIIDDFRDAHGLDAIILCFNLDAPGRIAKMVPAIGPSLGQLRKPALVYSSTLVADDNRRGLATLGVHQYTLRDCTVALAALRRITQFRDRWHDERSTRPRPMAAPPVRSTQP